MFLYVFLGFIVVCAVGAIYGYKQSKKEEKKNQESEKYFNEHKPEYTKQYEDYKMLLEEDQRRIVGKPIKVVNIMGMNAIINDKNQLIFFHKYLPIEASYSYTKGLITPKKGSIVVEKSYNISDILFWQEKGDVQYTTQVQGGGANLKGAVMGAYYAGAAGAVIGSRQAVTTSTTTHDSREIIIKYKNGQQESCTYDYYDAFIKLIPTLEYTYIQMNK